MLTEEQKKERMTGIGGSDASAICGFNKWATPFKIYQSKLELQPDIDNRFIEWGNRLEQAIHEKAEEILGEKIERPKTLYRSKEHDFMIANLDGWIEDKRIVCEYKTADFFNGKKYGDELSDSIPNEYLFQLAHYAIVMDASECHLFVLIGGNNFKQFVYKRNKKLEESLIKIESKFWNENVKKRIPPTPVKYEEALQTFETATDDDVVSSEARVIVDMLNATKREINRLKEEEDALKTQICNIMNDKTHLIDEHGDVLATWKPQKRVTIDTSILKDKFPDIINSVTKTSYSRILRVSGS